MVVVKGTVILFSIPSYNARYSSTICYSLQKSLNFGKNNSSSWFFFPLCADYSLPLHVHLIAYQF